MGAATRLWNRDFVLLWQGQLVSQLGSQAAFVATMLWTFEVTGSPGLLALLMLTSTVPGVALGPLAGTVVDRQSRKAILVIGDVVRGLATLLVGFGMLRWRTDPAAILPLLFLSAAVNGASGAVFSPAVKAALPDILPPQRLAAGNSLTTMGGQLSSATGLAAGGALYAAVGPAALFIADGISYLISAATEAFIRLPRAAPAAAGGLRGALGRYLADTSTGFRYCLEDPGRRAFIVVAGGLNFLFMPIFVLLPVYVERDLAGGGAWYGLILAGLSAGSLLGLFVAGAVGDRPALRGPALIGALLGTGASMAALALVAHPAQALATLALTGALTGVVNILVITLMQVRTPPDLRGRALAVLIAVTGAATPLGLAAGGLLGELAEGRLRELFGACGITAVILVALYLSRGPLRGFIAPVRTASTP